MLFIIHFKQSSFWPTADAQPMSNDLVHTMQHCHRDHGIHIERGGDTGMSFLYNGFTNRTSCIRNQCRKTTALSCHRYLINTGVKKMNYI